MCIVKCEMIWKVSTRGLHSTYLGMELLPQVLIQTKSQVLFLFLHRLIALATKS